MAWTEQDWTLLTQLRPGTPFDEFIAPLGGKLKADWEEESFEMTDDEGEEIFSGSIDEDGNVDGFTINDDRASFDGIAPGMSFTDLQEKVTGLFRDCSDDAWAMKYDEDFDSYWAPHSPGIAWHFIRTDDIVLTVSLVLSDDDVTRVDPFFEDVNFKLVVIESLVRDGLFTLPEGESVDDLEEDEDEEGEYSDEYVARVVARLDECYELPLKKADLDKIEFVEFDGGSEIYHYIHPLFDGESDEFDVMGMEGIENLPNLTSLSIISMTQNLSLLPLANHPKLEEVSLSNGIFKDFSALESVPNLKKISGFFDGEIYEEDDEVLKRLAAKGVDVNSFD